jgi:hypothetical protein
MRNKDNFGALALAFLLMLILLGGCMTNRKGELTEKGKNFIATHCKGSDSTVTNTEVIFKDTTLYITEKGETIYIQNPCDSVKPITTKKNGIKSSVRQVGKGLVFECEADSLRAVIKTMSLNKTKLKQSVRVIEKPCNKEHISGTQWMWIRLGQILSGFILLQVLLKFGSLYVPFLKVFYVFKF